MRDISEIIKDGSDALERLLREAFDAGVAHGRHSAVAEVRAKFDTILGGPAIPQPTFTLEAEPGHFAISGAPAEVAVTRAAPGTVKPTILRTVIDANFSGITTEELIERTGFKATSVRGTVSTLQMDGAIKKIAGRWYSAESLLANDGTETNKGSVE